ncbi:MAG: NYN domain-containing protein, partial [Chloroflexi bacterium]|nr:NYN domain-containing protein [Chloroflexota bacterium]
MLESSNNTNSGTEDPASRVAIFIDGSNLYHALEENCRRADLSFPKFVHKLLRGRRLLRTYYYNILQDSRRK